MALMNWIIRKLCGEVMNSWFDEEEDDWDD